MVILNKSFQLTLDRDTYLGFGHAPCSTATSGAANGSVDWSARPPGAGGCGLEPQAGRRHLRHDQEDLQGQAGPPTLRRRRQLSLQVPHAGHTMPSSKPVFGN